MHEYAETRVLTIFMCYLQMLRKNCRSFKIMPYPSTRNSIFRIANQKYAPLVSFWPLIADNPIYLLSIICYSALPQSLPNNSICRPRHWPIPNIYQTLMHTNPQTLLIPNACLAHQGAFVHANACVRTSMHAYMHVLTHMCMCVYVYVCMCITVCVCITEHVYPTRCMCICEWAGAYMCVH